MPEVGIVGEGGPANGGQNFPSGDAGVERAAQIRDGLRLVFRFDGRNERRFVPWLCVLCVGIAPGAKRIPCEMRDRFHHGREPLCVRRRALGEPQPVGSRGMGVGRAEFEMLVLRFKRVDKGDAGVEAGALQPRHFARHARRVVVRHRRNKTVERAPLLCVGGRITQVDKDLAGPQFDRIGAHRIAADKRLAARQIELPVVPVAGQNAARSFGAFAERIAFMRTAVGDGKELAVRGDQQNLLSRAPYNLAAFFLQFAVADAGCGEHGRLFFQSLSFRINLLLIYARFAFRK